MSLKPVPYNLSGVLQEHDRSLGLGPAQLTWHYGDGYPSHIHCYLNLPGDLKGTYHPERCGHVVARQGLGAQEGQEGLAGLEGLFLQGSPQLQSGRGSLGDPVDLQRDHGREYKRQGGPERPLGGSMGMRGSPTCPFSSLLDKLSILVRLVGSFLGSSISPIPHLPIPPTPTVRSPSPME